MIRLKDLLFESVARRDALGTNAKAVWDMYQTETDEQKIADKLGINLTTVQKIIKICLMKSIDDKTINQISDEMKLSKHVIQDILTNAMPGWEREKDLNFNNDAEDIYNLHKQGKSPEQIVNLINQNRKPYLQIKLDKVNLVLKIVDIATKQMETDGVLNIREIGRQTNNDVDNVTILRLIKRLGIGKIRYQHKFTPEQDAFILYNYLQRIGPAETARLFNEKFSNELNKLNIDYSSIRRRLIKTILKSNSESEISEYTLKLLRDYKDEYFPMVDINNADAKELLTHYTAPPKIGGKDKLARDGGKTPSNRPIAGAKGNLYVFDPDTPHQTFTTGTSPDSYQLRKNLGAPPDSGGALQGLVENTKQFKKLNGNTFILNS